MIDENKLIAELEKSKEEIQKKIDSMPGIILNLKNEKKAYDKAIDSIKSQLK